MSPTDLISSIKAMRPAVPAKDYAESRRFYEAVGFQPTALGPTLTEMRLGAHSFLLQDFYVPEFAVSLSGLYDTDELTAAWDAALQAPVSDGPPVWLHGDLHAANLLIERGQLSAVIDFGGLGVGDPACDFMAAWTLFSGESRDAFRAALSIDDASWARGRGWALSQALIFVPYYLNTNPEGVAIARHAIDEVLAES